MTFRFRPALTAAALAALAILCSLGIWQVQRLQWKNALIAKTHARLADAPIPLAEALARAEAGEDLEYQPVFADGAFRGGLEAHVFGTHDGKPGAFVFAPFDWRGDEGRTAAIYVNRGFAPQDFTDPATRGGPISGDIRVEGLFRLAEAKRGLEKALSPDDQPADNLYFTRDPARLAAAHGLSVPPFYIDSFERESEGAWPKGGLTRVEFANRHLEYALTWFGLAAALIGVYLALSLRRD
jgi:surfeit locus 1 family protein